MIGIYKITNLMTGECYIGQSKDIERRFMEHKNHCISSIDRDIQNYGIQNFSFDIIQECNEDELNELEDYYIDYYNSYINGYNSIKGGTHNKGESNPNAKLTESDVFDIREAYKNHELKSEVYKRYSKDISESYFSSIWEGSSWKNTHYDVYTEDNKNYYKFGTSVGEKSSKAKFSDKEVIELRTRYINESAESIYESVKHKCSLIGLKQLLWGRTYSHLPVYSKRHRCWK